MYDIAIIGAGPAGLSAAVYGQRAQKTTLLIDDKGYGGQIVNTPEIENYPAIQNISGFDFANNLFEQATALGAEHTFEKAISIEDRGIVRLLRQKGGSTMPKPLSLPPVQRTGHWVLIVKSS